MRDISTNSNCLWSVLETREKCNSEKANSLIIPDLNGSSETCVDSDHIVPPYVVVLARLPSTTSSLSVFLRCTAKTVHCNLATTKLLYFVVNGNNTYIYVKVFRVYHY